MIFDSVGRLFLLSLDQLGPGPETSRLSVGEALFRARASPPGSMRHFTEGSVILHHKVHVHVGLHQLPVNLVQVMQGVKTCGQAPQPRGTIVKCSEGDAGCNGPLDKVHGQPLVQPPGQSLRSANSSTCSGCELVRTPYSMVFNN